jgi:hypothetical protein
MVEQEWQDALDLEKALKPWCYPFLPPPAGAVPGCRCPLVLQIEAQGCERTQERWFFLLQQSWIISHPASFFFHWRFYTLISGSKWMLWMKLPSFWIKPPSILFIGISIRHRKEKISIFYTTINDSLFSMKHYPDYPTKIFPYNSDAKCNVASQNSIKKC